MIQDEEKLYQEIEKLEERWSKLNTDLSTIQRQKEVTTQADEKIRLQDVIGHKQQDQQELEHLIRERKPNDYNEIKQRVLVNRAYTYKQNRAYEQALDQWQQISTLYPENNDAAAAISILRELIEQQELIRELRKQVMRRVKEIKSIYKQVIQRLQNLSESNDDQALLDQVQLFADGDIDAEDFIDSWELFSGDQQPLQATPRIDYQKLAGRIKRGEIIVFLGSGVQQEYDSAILDEPMLAEQLAQHIKLGSQHNGSLSLVSEYFECRNDYGRPNLLQTLQQQLPDSQQDTAQTIGLYHSLARSERPLILISSAYDNLLEQAFQQHRKRYVEILSVTNPHGGEPVGNVILHYSDRDNPSDAPTLSKDALSQLNLLEQGYSLIYKIRGTCDALDCASGDVHVTRQDALTLMESDYFNFARYSERIIPGYVAKQFRTREFLFVGFRPRFWEDRLLVNAILEKRSNVKRDCMLIGDSSDEFEAAYWDKRNVRRYEISIQQLDEHLNRAEEVIL